jgi:hypothetical protein
MWHKEIAITVLSTSVNPFVRIVLLQNPVLLVKTSLIPVQIGLFENKVHIRIFRPIRKKQQDDGENCTMRSLIIIYTE